MVGCNQPQTFPYEPDYAIPPGETLAALSMSQQQLADPGG